jgi:hypothetical protein
MHCCGWLRGFSEHRPLLRCPFDHPVTFGYRAIAKIQYRAARLISGAFRATSGPALDIDLYVLPMHLQLEKRALETAIDIRTGPWTETTFNKENQQTRAFSEGQLGGRSFDTR